MSTKTFSNVRTKQKHDIESNWLKAIGFTPLDGELIVYDPDDTNTKPRFKVGNGEDNVNILPFATSDIELKSGTNVTVTKNEDGSYTISSTDTNTTYDVVSTTAAGLVPVRPGGSTKFLRADGTWAVPPDTDTDTTYSSGTGISLNGTVINHSNSITAGSTVTPGTAGTLAYSGSFKVPKISYDAQGHITSVDSVSFTLPGAYSLPQATSSVLGGIKIGYTQSGKNYPVVLDTNGKAYVSVPWTDNNTTYDPVTTTTNGLMIASDKAKLDTIDENANYIVVETALSSTSTNTIQNKAVYAAIVDAKSYADNAALTVKNDLLNGAGTAYDTLKELGDLISTNVNAIEALETVAANKVDTIEATGTAPLTLSGSISGTKLTLTGNVATAAKDTLGVVKTSSTVTSTSGLTASPIINGIVYYKNTTYSNMIAATASAAGGAGLVPAPAAGKQTSFLRGDGTWVIPTNTTYSNFVKSGSNAAAGLVPAPPTTAGTTKYLREDGTWTVPPNDTYNAVTTSANGLMISTDKSKLDYTNIAYGTCSTAAATAAKVITVSGNTNWKLTAGSRITIKFSATNTASNPTFNVNGTGAKSVWYNTALITTSNLAYAGYANRPMDFVYDGTQYVFTGWSIDNNSDTKVTQTTTNVASDVSTNWYILSGTSGSTSTDGAVKHASARLLQREGTAETYGFTQLVLGNGVSSGTAGNRYGQLVLYSPGTNHHTIIPTSTSSVVNHTLPASSGTIAHRLIKNSLSSVTEDRAVTPVENNIYYFSVDAHTLTIDVANITGYYGCHFFITFTGAGSLQFSNATYISQDSVAPASGQNWEINVFNKQVIARCVYPM